MGFLLAVVNVLDCRGNVRRRCYVHSHHDHFWYLSGDCRHPVVTMSSIRPGLTEQDLRVTRFLVFPGSRFLSDVKLGFK